MKNKILLLTAVLGLTSALALGQSFIGNATPDVGDSGVFAFWNFESPPSDGSPVNVTFYGQPGSTEIDLSGFGGNLSNFTGTTINEQPGFADPSNRDFALQTGTGGNAISGTWFQINFNMTNLESLVIDYAVQGSATGPSDVVWQYSTDGSNFTTFGPNVGARSLSRDLASEHFGPITTSALDGLSNVSLRMLFNNGAEGSSTPTATAGNNRIDNLTFSATAIPEPGTLALIGVSALILYFRRRIKA